VKNQGLRQRLRRIAPGPALARGAGWVAVAVLLGACAAGPQLRVAGEPAERSLTLTQDEVRLTLVPDAWNAYPGSLTEHYRPILARIENGRQADVLIRLSDFTATDQAGNQYRTVPPTEVAHALFGAGWGAASDLALSEARLYASSWPWWRYRARGYHYSPFWGPYYPWIDPWWDYPYTRPRPTPYDILNLGLREGRVLPGARVEGFLYLQQVRPQATLVTLLWTPVLAGGQPLTAMRAQFQVVR
jgi:hypothetical protein